LISIIVTSLFISFISAVTFHLRFKAIFSANADYPIPPRISSCTFSGREPLGINGTDFYVVDVLAVPQPTVSKLWRKLLFIANK